MPGERSTLDQTKLHQMARHLAFTRAIHESPDDITEDLEQAAWLKYLTLKSDKYLWRDLEYAMLEELSRWIWQCKRGRGRSRRLLYKLSIDEIETRLDHGWSPKQLMAEPDLERFYG